MEQFESDLVLKTKDYFLTGEEFCLYRNHEFGFLETRPVPIDKLSDYYNSENYISHSDARKSFWDRIYQSVKKYNIGYKFSKLGYKEGKKSLLDFGCGTGDFLKYAQNKGLDVYGIEPNPDALKLTQKKVGDENASSSNLVDLDMTFDYITLWHVLEHIPNLNEFITELKTKLKPDGKILIAVPNHKSFDAKFYKSCWAAWDVPRHIWHFSNDSFQKLMYKNELKKVKLYPLWFDSFYISILSEKYKKSKFGIFRAIPIAILSNTKALFDKNWSSVIYLIQKN